MAKRKEIKFRLDRRVYVGRQNGVIFRLYWDQETISSPTYSVTAVDTKHKGREIDTAGHKHFSLDAAKEFCQQIAAGEIDMEAMQAKFAAEDKEKKQAAIRAAAEAAKKFHATLGKFDLKYSELLFLENLRADLGKLAHNMLLDYERGEGWPDVEAESKQNQSV